MDELKVQIALEIIELKIVHLLKNNRQNNIEEVKKELNTLVEEREKIYALDQETIDKVYNVYLEEIKGNRKGNN